MQQVPVIAPFLSQRSNFDSNSLNMKTLQAENQVSRCWFSIVIMHSNLHTSNRALWYCKKIFWGLYPEPKWVVKIPPNAVHKGGGLGEGGNKENGYI